MGKRIRDERLLLRLTLEQLAERVSKSSNFIGQIERGDRKMSLETLVDIANALGTTVDSLLKDNIQPYNGGVAREMNMLLYNMDDTGKSFVLDIAKRYAHYHNNKNN